MYARSTIAWWWPHSNLERSWQPLSRRQVPLDLFSDLSSTRQCSVIGWQPADLVGNGFAYAAPAAARSRAPAAEDLAALPDGKQIRPGVRRLFCPRRLPARPILCSLRRKSDHSAKSMPEVACW